MKKSEKHTPGPWEVELVSDGETARVVSRGFSDEAPGICGAHSKTWPLLADDAQLIAAAPALLKACRTVLAFPGMAKSAKGMLVWDVVNVAVAKVDRR